MVAAPGSPGSGQQSGADVAGFSTRKRRSRFEEAIRELELVYNNIAEDEDLLDRAERRDLPTAHQLLIWRDRESEESLSHNTSAESAMSDLDTFLNWNTSSSFEHVSGLASPTTAKLRMRRMRTPDTRRRLTVSDKASDDMMVRRISAANKVPVSQSSTAVLGSTSYLSVTSALDTTEAGATEWEPDAEEPDIRVDDVLNRSVRDANQIRVISEPQPVFGLPLGPVTGGASSDYLHAVPEDRYRSTFNPMRNPDLVKDDLAFRHLRKDESLEDPGGLGIVKDPHGLISPPGTNWPPSSQTRRSPPNISYSDKHNQMTRSLSENIAHIIRKQSSKPGAKLDEIISYQDLSDPLVYDTIKYTMDLINKRKTRSDKSVNIKSQATSSEKHGTTMYELFRHHQSEPESLDTLEPGEKEKQEEESKDEGVSSVSSPDLGPQLPDLVTGEGPHGAGETEHSRPMGGHYPRHVITRDQSEARESKPDPENPQQVVVQSCLIEQNNVDPYYDKTPEIKNSRTYISSLIEEEESKRLSIKSLSDGGSVEEEDTHKEMELHKIQSELQEVVEKIDRSLTEGQEERKNSFERLENKIEKEEEPAIASGLSSVTGGRVVSKRPDQTKRGRSEAGGGTRRQSSPGLGLLGEAGDICKLSSEPCDEDISLPGV